MPIEFRCSQCGKLLRTGDDTAGRQAQCPECEAIGTVPTPPAGGNPFAAGATVIDVGLCAVSPAQRVSGPATALTVTAILSVLAHLGIAALYGVVLIAALTGKDFQVGRGDPRGVPDQQPEGLVLGSSMIETWAVLGLVADAIVLIGARKMARLESHAFAMAAAIVALIPCLGPCCLLGLPFGIWALVVLGDSSVKAAFRG
jgi:hypothetical protein